MTMPLNELLTNVRVGEQTVFDVAGGPEARKLTVELRKLHPEEARPPKRAESPAKKHEFFAAASLAAYLAKYGSEHTVVFADPNAEMIHAVLDERAKDGFEVLTMRPALHPLWKPWAEVAGRRVPLRDFAQFVAQNRRVIVQPDGKSLTLMLSQVRASVSVEVQHGRGKEAVNGLMIKTKIQGVEKQDSVEIPDEITIDVPLYVDTENRPIELDLCLEADRDGEVSVLVSAGTVAEARVAAFEDMVEVIRAGIADKGATVTFGRPQHGPWAYLRELNGAA